MKTLEEIRTLFVEARIAVKTGKEEFVKVAAENLQAISDHCKEVEENEKSYLEKAKSKNLYESLEHIIAIMTNYGSNDQRVQAFFGLIKATEEAPSFEKVAKGEGKIKAPVINNERAIKGNPLEDDGAVEVKSGTPKKARVLPPPAPKVSATEKGVEEPPLTSAVATGKSEEIELPKTENESNTEWNAEDIYNPQSLDEFVGQTLTVKRLKEEIQVAKILGKKHLDHIMLFANRGLGKSTLMRLIAKELGVGYEFINGGALSNDVRSQRKVQSFFKRIADNGKPVVVAIDEIHAVPKHIQTGLLTLLQDGVYSYLDENGAAISLPLPEFTFIGCTTDYDAVLPTIKDRANNLTFFLVDYTREELRKIFERKLASLGFHADTAVIDLCINRCRSSVREVDAIVKGLRTKVILAKDKIVTADMVEACFADRKLDAIGLSAKDLEILKAIEVEPSGIIAEETLAAKVYLDPKILTKEYEPYLIKIGFIGIGVRGRTLTRKALDYLRYGYYDFGGGVCIGERPNANGATESIVGAGEDEKANG